MVYYIKLPPHAQIGFKYAKMIEIIHEGTVWGFCTIFDHIESLEKEDIKRL